MTREIIVHTLKEKRCRITKQRSLIIDILIKHQTILLTAEDILLEAKKEDPSINLTTVYRNIDCLKKYDLIFSQSLDMKTMSYKIRCTEHHHHHITCKGCGRTTPIDYCPVTDELINLASSMGYNITDHSLELFGTCDKCEE